MPNFSTMCGGGENQGLGERGQGLGERGGEKGEGRGEGRGEGIVMPVECGGSVDWRFAFSGLGSGLAELGFVG